MWVEPDTNMPTGESLARQILYGQRYFEKQFGKRHTVCWLPDCFGFSGALPQLLQQGGIDSFFTIKVNWSETNRIPADLFWWEGLDGIARAGPHLRQPDAAAIMAIVQPDCYRADLAQFPRQDAARHLAARRRLWRWRRRRDARNGRARSAAARLPGHAEGPLGPGRRLLRRARTSAATEVELPVWSGEIYLELHRATLTTQSGVKRMHRQAERALITAETVASLAHLLGARGAANPRAALARGAQERVPRHPAGLLDPRGL